MDRATTSSITLISLVLLTGLLTMGWLLMPGDFPSERPSPESQQSAVAEASKAPLRLDREAPGTRERNSRQYDRPAAAADFFAASSASEAAAALDAIDITRDNEAEVMALRDLLARTCSEDRPWVLDTPRQAWYLERIDAYCGNYSISAEARQEIHDWTMTYAVALSEELMASMRGLTLAGQSAFLLEQIGEARSALDLDAVALALGGSFYEARATDQEHPWQIHALGQDPTILYRDPQGRDIQRAALTLLRCQAFLDCGPDSPLTWNYCFSHPVCEPGWDLYDYLNHVHSPLEDEQILAVLELLLELRDG